MRARGLGRKIARLGFRSSCRQHEIAPVAIDHLGQGFRKALDVVGNDPQERLPLRGDDLAQKTLNGLAALGSVLNRDSIRNSAVIQASQWKGGLNGKAGLLAQRCGMAAD